MSDDSEKFRRWLRKMADQPRHAELVYWHDVEKLSIADAALKAGYSGGSSADEDARRKQLSGAGSRALRTKKVQRLRQELRDYREMGAAAPIAAEGEILGRLTDIVRRSTDAAVITAGKQLLDHHRRGGNENQSPDFPRRVIDECCRRRAPLLQALAVQTGRMWRDGGMPCMAGWEPPARCHQVVTALEQAGISPLDCTSLLVAMGERRDE